MSKLANTIDLAHTGQRRPAPPREFRTRKPSGKPSWPIVLVAGGDKCGKSYAVAELSASESMGTTWLVEVGEGRADLYGEIPGARYEIVEHDGSFDDIYAAIDQAIQQPPSDDGKPTVIAIDGVTEIWDMLSGEQQLIATERAARRAGQSAKIESEQWSDAKKRWRDLLDLLRTNNGPVILTARLEPTTEGPRDYRIRTEKNLPYEVDLVVQIPHVRQHRITGVASLALPLPKGGYLDWPDLALADVFANMGLAPETTQARVYVAPKPQAALT